jgi:hypothetical protein
MNRVTTFVATSRNAPIPCAVKGLVLGMVRERDTYSSLFVTSLSIREKSWQNEHSKEFRPCLSRGDRFGDKRLRNAAEGFGA